MATGVSCACILKRFIKREATHCGQLTATKTFENKQTLGKQTSKLAQQVHRAHVGAPSCMLPPTGWLIRLAPKGPHISSLHPAVHGRTHHSTHSHAVLSRYLGRGMCSSAERKFLAAGGSSSSYSTDTSEQHQQQQQPTPADLQAVVESNMNSILSSLTEQSSSSHSSRSSSSPDGEVPMVLAGAPKKDRKPRNTTSSHRERGEASERKARKRVAATADNNALSIIPGVGPKNASLLGSKDIHDIPRLMRVYLEEHKADSEATKRYLQVRLITLASSIYLRNNLKLENRVKICISWARLGITRERGLSVTSRCITTEPHAQSTRSYRDIVGTVESHTSTLSMACMGLAHACISTRFRLHHTRVTAQCYQPAPEYDIRPFCNYLIF